jgi:DNA-binding transcriptional LysR family regulator
MISASARRLSVFKSVVDCGGFNLAAAAIGIAQPSVGAHIKALEAQVGQPLFQRARGSRPQLTKAGQALYTYAVEVLQKSQATSQTLAALRSNARQEIAIAVHRDIAMHFLPARLSAFRSRYPNIHIITRIGTIDDVTAQVRARSVDLGLFLASETVPGLRSEVIDHVPLALVVSSDHPLARRKGLTASALKRHSFVTGLNGSSFNQLADAAMRHIGLDSYEVTMELEESTAAKEMVRHGLGIACLPRCTVSADLASGSLIELSLSVPLPELELRCGHKRALSETAQKFLHHIR